MEIIEKLADSYNRLPYTSYAFSYTQPDHLHALGVMRGLTPPPIEKARVLEIGCSFGGNVFPMALRYPNMQITAVDLSQTQIDVAQKLANAGGIDNIQFIAGDITKQKFRKQFDYIICHGVYSWVPKAVQEGILKCIAKHLSPNGLAFVSYNTYPGWKYKEVVRDLMQMGSAQFKNEQARINRALEFAKFTNIIMQRHDSVASRNMGHMFEHIIEQSPSYISHEYLEWCNDPCYFSDFVKQAEAHQLGHFIDSNNFRPLHHKFEFEEEFSQICAYFQNDFVQLEQFADILHNREFRCSVITHQANLDAHGITHDFQQREALEDLQKVCVHTPVHFTPPQQHLRGYWALNGNTDIHYYESPLSNAIFSRLQSGESVAVSELYAIAQQVPNANPQEVDEIIRNICYDRTTVLSATPTTLTPCGEKPTLSPRLRGLRNGMNQHPETALFSTYFSLADPMTTTNPIAWYLLPYLDGQHDVAQLIQKTREGIASGELELRQNDEIQSNEQIADEVIQAHVQRALVTLELNGYFTYP